MKKAASSQGNKNVRGQTSAKNNRTKAKQSSKIGQSKQLSKGPSSKDPTYTFERLQQIFNSDAYQSLSQTYAKMKQQSETMLRELKTDICSLNRQLSREEIKLAGLVNLKYQLKQEMDYLIDKYEEIRLQNYEMKCQLYRRDGFGQQGYYESLREIVF